MTEIARDQGTTQHKARELESLVQEFARWNALPGRERDEYGSFAQLAAIYEYAISNYNEPGIGHLLEAIAFSEDPA